MKTITNFQTTAVKRAAQGTLDRPEQLSRSTSLYGFKNRALSMTAKEIKEAWINASVALRKSRD